ncbi:MAG: hypothetical protein ACREYA_27455 [Cupriavidus necator]
MRSTEIATLQSRRASRIATLDMLHQKSADESRDFASDEQIPFDRSVQH